MVSCVWHRIASFKYKHGFNCTYIPIPRARCISNYSTLPCIHSTALSIRGFQSHCFHKLSYLQSCIVIWTGPSHGEPSSVEAPPRTKVPMNPRGGDETCMYVIACAHLKNSQASSKFVEQAVISSKFNYFVDTRHIWRPSGPGSATSRQPLFG